MSYKTCLFKGVKSAKYSKENMKVVFKKMAKFKFRVPRNRAYLCEFQ